ncbi:alpha/beta hydrolase [Stanieria cyanosphaera]|nr:alpha/beta hydrolase [Stanieria cyanosphaera]
MPKQIKPMMLILGGLILTIYVMICGVLRWKQTKLIFFPSPVVVATPKDYQLAYEEVWLPVSTGKIHGWWIPASTLEAPVILYLHGNGSNNGDTIGQATRFHQLNFSTLLIDYRGYGYSSGPFPNETLVYEDAEAAWQYLTVERKINPNKIIVYGHSLGGAIALELATRHPELAGLIVNGTFTSMRAIAAYMKQYRILPLDWILTQKFDSITKIKTLKTPILLMHGIEDRVVPAWMSQELFTATAAPKQLWLVPKAGHNDLAKVAGEEYLEKIKQFVEQVTK